MPYVQPVFMRVSDEGFCLDGILLLEEMPLTHKGRTAAVQRFLFITALLINAVNPVRRAVNTSHCSMPE